MKWLHGRVSVVGERGMIVFLARISAMHNRYSVSESRAFLSDTGIGEFQARG